MCGRGFLSKKPPNYCYFDRMNFMENLSDKDALEMNIKIDKDEGKEFIFEFPADVRFDPFNGGSLNPIEGGSLRQYQLEIFNRVKL
jgi:hypothetical protein